MCEWEVFHYEPADDEGGLVQYPFTLPSFFADSPGCVDLRRRSVRLRRGFVNLERAPFGGMKLRIPSLLYDEKMRTQTRFNVSRVICGVCLCVLY